MPADSSSTVYPSRIPSHQYGNQRQSHSKFLPQHQTAHTSSQLLTGCSGTCGLDIGPQRRLKLLRKLGHRPGGYGNAVEDYWLWLRRSLMRAHPYSSWLSNIKALKLVKAVAGLEKVILVCASNLQAWHQGTQSTQSITHPARRIPMTCSQKYLPYTPPFQPKHEM